MTCLYVFEASHRHKRPRERGAQVGSAYGKSSLPEWDRSEAPVLAFLPAVSTSIADRNAIFIWRFTFAWLDHHRVINDRRLRDLATFGIRSFSGTSNSTLFSSQQRDRCWWSSRARLISRTSTRLRDISFIETHLSGYRNWWCYGKSRWK